MVRLKERYLLVNILYPPDAATPHDTNVPDYVALHRPTTDKMESRDLLKGIRAQVLTLFGDYGTGVLEGNLQVKYLSRATSTFILKAPRTHYRLAWAALTFMGRIPISDGKPCTFRVVRVGGSLRKVEEEAVRRARQIILAARDYEAKVTSNLLRQSPSIQGVAASEPYITAMDIEDESEEEEHTAPE